MRLLKFFIISVVGMFALLTAVYPQGVTTSSIKGRVSDNTGNPVYSATIVATHLPSGTQYGTLTLSDGGFLLRNMKIGGPYELKVSFVGYDEYKEEEIYLSLNKTSEFNITLQESMVQLQEISVTYDKVDVINSDRTGSMTSINSDAIIALPSIKRSSLDLTRLTPESNGNSFGGRNNLYNNFSLDGSIFNNSFGLDYATPGGQTDAQPVSIEAIEQIQVSLAPFDVREGGFTGAGVNAVTKSGTNEFKGSAYYFFRNDKMIGQKVGDIEAPNLDFSTSLYGFSVGGPIIKNKLFFYVNGEAERRKQLAHGYIADNGANTGQANVTSVIEDSIQMVQDYLREYWNYEPGAYQNYYHETFNNKLLAKLNWNVNKNNNVTLRYNMLDSWKDILPHPEAIIGRGPTTFRLPFENSSYRIFNKIHSLVGEVHSIISTKLSNKLLLGYTGFRDHREPFSEPYPVIDIFDANGNLAITMGSEMFSTHNILNQDVFQVTDNITFYTEKHTFTGGMNFELFSFENSFNLFYYPWDTFGSVAAFLENDRSGIDFDAQVAANENKPLNWSYVDVGQLALYIQDEFQVSEKLNLTFGLRTDLPIYFSDVVTATNSDAIDVVENFTGWVDENGDPATVKPSEWPKGVIMWSPRFGFNFDIKGDATMQLRGGSGIFSGRIPFVWLGNQAGNA
ncbi:TonB-dependent receptor, partial [bacterium]|nr:TonB-dependent receptor [bacterium]